jgi:hypothetical protein
VKYDDLGVGLVFQTDWTSPGPYRILAFDEFEVLYDAWWSHLGAWGLRNLRGTAHYYRVTTQLVLEHAQALRVDPLSELELPVHRPDLPLRLLRFKDLEWNAAPISSNQDFSAWLSTAAPDLAPPNSDVALDIPVVALAPYGPKGGTKRPIVITAENGRNFSSLELLWRAANIQAPISSQLRHGVGIYRLGCASARPTFYLWGAVDKARFLA